MSRKKRFITSAVLLCLLLSGCARTAHAGEPVISNSIMAYVAADGLHVLDYNTGMGMLLDTSGQIKSPLLSPDNTYVAYQKEDKLYVCGTRNSDQAPFLAADGSFYYCWKDDSTLCYSGGEPDQGGGITLLSVTDRTTSHAGGPEFVYRDLVSDGGDTLYVRKVRLEDKDGESQTHPLGIFSLNLKNGEETALINAISYTDENYHLGASYEPHIQGLSADKQYLYIWDRTASGSLSADGIRFGIYDLQSNVFMRLIGGGRVDGPILPEEEWDMYILQNNANISADPNHPLTVVMNLGEGREMYQNKHLVLTDYRTGTQKDLTGESQVTHSVSYALDGSSIYYASTPALTREESAGDFSSIRDLWYSREHAIYRTNPATDETVQITSGHFDMLPCETAPGVILFVRVADGRFSLWKTDGSGETMLADRLDFNSEYAQSGFYLAFQPDRILDIHR